MFFFLIGLGTISQNSHSASTKTTSTPLLSLTDLNLHFQQASTAQQQKKWLSAHLHCIMIQKMAPFDAHSYQICKKIRQEFEQWRGSTVEAPSQNIHEWMHEWMIGELVFCLLLLLAVIVLIQEKLVKTPIIILWIIATSSIGYWSYSPPRLLAYNQQSIALKSGPGDHFTTLQDLLPGTPLKIEQIDYHHAKTHQGWRKIQTPNGQKGWTPLKDLIILPL